MVIGGWMDHTVITDINIGHADTLLGSLIEIIVHCDQHHHHEDVSWQDTSLDNLLLSFN